MNLLEALSARMNARRTNANDVLVAAARRLAAGESADDAAVERALVETGTSLDAFRELVELCQRRREWYVSMDRGPAAAARVAKANATLEREAAAFQATHDAWMERRRQLSADLDDAERIVAAARAARDELLRPDNVPGDLANRLREAHDGVVAAACEVERLNNDRRHWVEQEKTQRGWAEEKRRLNKSTPQGDAEDHARAADRAARRVADIDAQLPAARDAAEAAEKHLAATEAAALKT
jgi:hypothetical protein